jgi:hypothetical protein
MYTGTLIEDLIATVERMEQYGRLRSNAELENWYAGAHSENVRLEQNLLGVA